MVMHFFPPALKKRRVGHLAETTSAASTQLVTLDGFKQMCPVMVAVIA